MTKTCLIAFFVIWVPSFLRHLLDQPDRDWIAIEFPLTRLNGGNDHQHQIQNVQDPQDYKTDQHQTKNASDHIIDQHRYLEIE
jgi:hypothetical protein